MAGPGAGRAQGLRSQTHSVAPVTWDEDAPSLSRAVPVHTGAEPGRAFGSRDGPWAVVFYHQLAGAPRLILRERGEHLLTPRTARQAGVPDGLAVPRGNAGPCPETFGGPCPGTVPGV